MKLSEVKEPGFYQVVPFNPEYHEIYEVYIDEKYGPTVDIWIYDYTDADGRKRYETDGGVYNPNNNELANLEVEKTKEKWFMPKLDLNAGHLLIEDKPTYEEQLMQIMNLCKDVVNFDEATDNIATRTTFAKQIESMIQLAESKHATK